jgi:hypothetical protein
MSAGRERPAARLRTRKRKEIIQMRFMVIVKASEESEAGALPDARVLAEMAEKQG